MKKTTSKRGRPKLAKPLTPAERMKAYRARKRAAGLKQVSEWVSSVQETSPVYSDHRILDARSLALHCKIVQKINENPKLLEIPLRNLKRWNLKSEGKPPHYIDEWQKILKQPWPEVAATITSCSENANRLRQSSPFAGVLNPKERKLIYEAFRA